MDFRLLGQFEVRQNGMVVDLGGPRQRAVLAALLLRPNTVATVDYLCSAVWRRLPASPATNLRTYVAGLRKRLRAAAGADSRLRTRPGGYLLVVQPDELDTQVFKELLDAASAAQRDGDHRRALEEFDQALALWRTDTVNDLTDSPALQTELVWLEELRMRAVEGRCTAMLELGMHKEVSVELRKVVTDHPLREELWANLMTALRLDGRRAEALDTFRQARAKLVTELGIEPGDVLRRRQQEVLEVEETEPSPAVPNTGNAHHLPMDIAEFTGREEELKRVFEVAVNLEHASAAEPTAVSVVVITGLAGIGKTRLAVHAAHRLVQAGRFDEIQLWADLAGSAPDREPATPETVLDGFLSALDVPPPPDPVVGAALFRDRIAGRRTLVVLDDAASADQVVPLLPGDASCLVLVTSRRNLVALDGARHVELDVFSAAEALTLLARIAGAERTAAEPDSARRLVDLCDRLPLAVALAARRLHTRPRWRVGRLTAKLAAPGNRLDELSSVSGLVAQAFDASYQALGPAQRRLFRVLGAHLCGDVDGPAAAALADLPGSSTERLLEELLDVHLLHQRVSGRYRMRGLVHLHARALAAGEGGPDEGDAAFVRLLRHYLARVEQALALLQPNEFRRVGLAGALADTTEGPATHATAVGWLRTEHVNLVAAARRGVGRQESVALLATRLAIALYRPLLNLLGAGTEQVELYQLAAAGAKRIGARREEALILEDLGTVLGQRGQLTESVEHTTRALRLWQNMGDSIGVAGCLLNVGIAAHQGRRSRDALVPLKRALAGSRHSGYRTGEASALNYLGLAYVAIGEPDLAVAHLKRSIAHHREMGSRHGVAVGVANLGWVHLRAGRPAEALPHHEEAMVIFREFADRYNEAEQIWALGQAHHALGHHEQARDMWRRAITALHGLRLLTQQEAERLSSQGVPETPEIIRLNT